MSRLPERFVLLLTGLAAIATPLSGQMRDGGAGPPTLASAPPAGPMSPLLRESPGGNAAGPGLAPASLPPSLAQVTPGSGSPPNAIGPGATMPVAAPLTVSATTRVQTPIEALAHDAAVYAGHYGVSPGEALRRLRLQQAGAGMIDALAATYADRLAGIFVEHVPDYRVVLLLTGTEAVAPRTLVIAGLALPVEFRTGALATRAAVLAALDTRADALRDALHYNPGLGADARTGMMVVVARDREIRSEGAGPMAERLGAIAGVPVQVRSAGGIDSNSAIEGGTRLIASEDGRRFLCTAGFVASDGTRTGILTAAHCPDRVSHIDAAGSATPLTLVSAWGARYQDVQVHMVEQAGAPPLQPLFQADGIGGISRRLTSWRNRAATHVGDFVCHRGERTGYSCAEVEFTDFAPPGDLCAGACMPTWVAVKGPSCRGGDSGGPVFSGSIAYGLVKGSSYGADGTCRRYYYMSIDYLPPGWRLLL